MKSKLLLLCSIVVLLVGFASIPNNILVRNLKVIRNDNTSEINIDNSYKYAISKVDMDKLKQEDLIEFANKSIKKLDYKRITIDIGNNIGVVFFNSQINRCLFGEIDEYGELINPYGKVKITDTKVEFLGKNKNTIKFK